MNFFVTGVTGNVGSCILRRLLEDSASRAWVLVRARDDEDARRRLGDLFRLWRLSDTEMSDGLRRVIPVRGDMGLPRFGLDEKTWDELVQHCDYLVHAAGVVRMNLPLEEARRHAVGSARNMMELAEAVAKAGREVSLAFISTVGVLGKLGEPLLEEWVTQPREFHNTYEQAKAEAEDLLRGWHREKNIHLTVHRPSRVVGASDGEILRHQIFYYICEFLSGRHTLGLQPALQGAKLDTVLVDYVADAVCWAVTHPESDGHIFNLCSGPDGEVGDPGTGGAAAKDPVPAAVSFFVTITLVWCIRTSPCEEAVGYVAGIDRLPRVPAGLRRAADQGVSRDQGERGGFPRRGLPAWDRPTVSRLIT